jgi:hypothetical protein
VESFASRFAKPSYCHMPIPGEWTRGAAVYRVRGGKVVGLRIWLNRDRAFADLGLEE